MLKILSEMKTKNNSEIPQNWKHPGGKLRELGAEKQSKVLI